MKKNYKEPANKVIELAGADAVLLTNTSKEADPNQVISSRQNAWDDEDEEDW